MDWLCDVGSAAARPFARLPLRGRVSVPEPASKPAQSAPPWVAIATPAPPSISSVTAWTTRGHSTFMDRIAASYQNSLSGLEPTRPIRPRLQIASKQVHTSQASIRPRHTSVTNRQPTKRAARPSQSTIAITLIAQHVLAGFDWLIEDLHPSTARSPHAATFTPFAPPFFFGAGVPLPPLAVVVFLVAADFLGVSFWTDLDLGDWDGGARRVWRSGVAQWRWSKCIQSACGSLHARRESATRRLTVLGWRLAVTPWLRSWCLLAERRNDCLSCRAEQAAHGGVAGRVAPRKEGSASHKMDRGGRSWTAACRAVNLATAAKSSVPE